jgi:hypothetical protein
VIIKSLPVEEMAQDRQRLDEILAGREFATHSQSSFDLFSLLERWLKSLLEWFRKLFPDTQIPTGAIDAAAYFVISAGILLLIVMVYWFAKQIVRQKRLSRKRLPHDKDMKRTSADYLQLAQQAKEQGEWRDGIRCLFLAILFYAERKSWLKVERWKTNGEYFEELRLHKPEFMRDFAEGALLFDRIWYGKESAGLEEFNSFYSRIEQLMKGGDSGGEME